MKRRRVLKSAGVSIATLPILTSSSVATEGETHGGGQPITGQLPNENAPEAIVSPLPPFFGVEGTTREVGQFLTVSGGWLDVAGNTKDLLNSTRQTFTFEDQTFVLDSFEDWESDGDGSFSFAHTDPPFPKGEVVDVSWDVIITAPFYDSTRDTHYEPGDRYVPSLFPTSRRYEIVGENKDG